MARLNEPAAAPPESLELLRRRFLRQNKEIIKINADQATKIRALETETSRLLSENITLREENIRVNHQLKKGQHARALENVGAVKDKLQLFASGLTDLLAELADAQSNLPEPTSHRATPKRRSPKAVDREWRGGLNLAELAMQEGRLPPIVEGKHYPRKTLDADDIGYMMQTSPLRPSPNCLSPNRPSPSLTDSPDLGPPPVIHFDVGDPTKQEFTPPSPSPVKSSSPEVRNHFENVDTRPLSSNLETRKKRRTSTFVGDAESRMSEHKESSLRRDAEDEEIDTTEAAKAGGKRKFSTQQGSKPGVNGRQQVVAGKGDRDAESRVDLPIREGRPRHTKGNVTAETQDSARHRTHRNIKNAPQARRALGEKPVNTDPVVSPSKLKSRQQNGTKSDFRKARPEYEKSGKGSAQSNHRGRDLGMHALQWPRKPDRAESIQYVEPEPESSVPVIDVVSPGGPSVLPEAESSNTSDMLGSSDAGERPSRRSRPAVSYAEPNLRVKMRRPTKEFVDAVSADSKSSRLSSGLPGQYSDEKAEEQVDAPDWRSSVQVPESPPISSRQERQTDDSPNGHESRVERIVSTSNKRLSRAREAAIARLRAEVESIAQADSSSRSSKNQDVFDVASSSSPEASGRAPRRAARRVTSVPAHMNSDDGSGGVARETRKRAGRRRETLADNANAAEADPVDTAKDVAVEGAAAGMYGERMTTRRRSMML